ncbi:hypothetical protein [Campylobacter concisus]|uniref:hypothetical protein n=1 Tax=Campylobacter concisus TaxID=199 RepID=UPI001CB71C8A|nr:hypothetical protein [Campylobacter concisus]
MMSLEYAVFRLELKNIENSDDWFDGNGYLKYKEKFLFDTLLDAGELKNAELVAIFNLRSDAFEFCQGAGFDENSDYFYFCTRRHYSLDAEMGEYVEVGY